MKKIIVGLVLFFMVLSCQNDQVLLLPTKEQSLYNERYDTLIRNSLSITELGASSIYAHDGFLFVERNDPKSQLVVYSCKSNEPVAYLCAKGRAKNEFNSAHSYCKQFTTFNEKKCLLMGDEKTLDIKFIDIEKSINQKTTVIEEVKQVPLASRNTGYSVIDTDHNKWFNHLLLYINPLEDYMEAPKFTITTNRKEKEVKTFGNTMDLTEDLLYVLYQGKMRISPDETKVVFAYIGMHYFFIYDLENNSGIAVHDTLKMTFDNPDEKSLKNDIDMFALDIVTTNNYIAILCPNNTVTNYYGQMECCPILRFFDWEGNYLTGVVLDNKIHEIAYDESSKKLYGLNIISEEIIQYDLSNIPIL
ncbi:MAG: hypothetical protein IK038_09665 [Bacteroidaceae bacterium]|nr:hypothetical protein [Bacteroidaceae bacterium]